MTYLEKAKLEQPDRLSAFSEEHIKIGAIGCPYSFGLEEKNKGCPL